MLHLLEGIVGADVPNADCSIVETRQKGTFLVSTTDFFFPLVDDPYIQGKIGCANVLSDLYSLGIVEIDTVLMLFGSSVDMKPLDASKVAKAMMKGFHDLCDLAPVAVTGGQSVRNKWPMIGGVAMAVCKDSEIIRPINAVPGDVLILTKPLGTQVIVNAHQWITSDQDRWDLVQEITTKEKIVQLYSQAALSMSTLNKTAASLMHKYGAHAATDVTGFGILGHANNLARSQTHPCCFEINVLPTFSIDVVNIARHCRGAQDFHFFAGYSAETSGGLLIALPEDKAKQFCEEFQEIEKTPCWIIGNVVERKNGIINAAKILPNATFATL